MKSLDCSSRRGNLQVFVEVIGLMALNMAGLQLQVEFVGASRIGLEQDRAAVAAEQFDGCACDWFTRCRHRILTGNREDERRERPGVDVITALATFAVRGSGSHGRPPLHSIHKRSRRPRVGPDT